MSGTQSIPADIFEAALEVVVMIRSKDVSTWELDGGCDIDFDSDSAVKRIAQAILEERERCASIAAGYNQQNLAHAIRTPDAEKAPATP